jgi:hypothetical protein
MRFLREFGMPIHLAPLRRHAKKDANENTAFLGNCRRALTDPRSMALAVITRVGDDRWKLTFWEVERGRPRRACSVECGWAAAWVVLMSRAVTHKAPGSCC